jgi:hypothetical protein
MYSDIFSPSIITHHGFFQCCCASGQSAHCASNTVISPHGHRSKEKIDWDVNMM